MTQNNRTNKASTDGPRGRSQAARASFPVIPAVLVLGVLAVGAAYWLKKPAPPASSPGADTSQTAPPAASAPDDNLPVEVSGEVAPAPASGRLAVATKRAQPAVAAAPATAPPPHPEPTTYMRQLVAGVASLDPAKVPQTPEQAAAWKQNLQQLVQQGAAAVPAIQEFLDKNVDFGFGKDAGQMLGYASERYAMFDALRQIGGPEAASAMAGALQTTADPHEIALLAQDLEQVAPGQYPQAALDAARQTLAMVTDGKLSQTDVAPLFDVLAKYGGAGAAAEIEQASANYKYYSAIALSQLPDGAGIPSLVRMVQDSSNGGGPVRNVPALEMLTEAAAQNSDARNALMDLARANGIPSRYWAYLAPLLAGDQIQYLDSASASSATAGAANNSDLRTYHIASGNQNFYSAPPVGGFTQDQINRQSQLIDGLLSVTSDPATVQMLQNAKAQLQKRLGQTAAAASPH